jgi:hypothetical protein
MGAIHTRKIIDPSQAAPPTLVKRLLALIATSQKRVQETLVSLPGWHQTEKLAATLTAPVRWLANSTQRAIPITRRFDWLLEIERIKTMHPVILLIAIGWAIRRGLFTTQYGHIGTDTLIYPTIATISYFNPFLGISTGIAFGVGDIVQKFFVNDIFGTNGRDANYYAALLGYCIAYSSLMVAGLLPGVMGRLFSLAARKVIGLGLSAVARARADGANDLDPEFSNLGNPLSGQYPIPELLASMAGAALGGYAVMHLAPRLEYPAFYLRPHPDVSCHNLEMGTYLIGRAGVVAEAAAIGGPILSTLLNPAEPRAGSTDGSSGGGVSDELPSSPKLTRPQALLAESVRNIEAARRQLDEMRASLRLLDLASRDAMRNNPEFRDRWNDAHQALDRAQNDKMQIESQLQPATPGATSDIGAPAASSQTGATGQSFDDRRFNEVGSQQSGTNPPTDISSATQPSIQNPAVTAPAVQPGAPPSISPSASANQLLDQYHADIFNPDGSVNTVGLNRLAPRLTADQIRALPTQVRQKLGSAFQHLVKEEGALHDAELAAFQGNLTPRSLALTIFNAARDAIAGRAAAAMARGTIASEEISAALKLAELQVASHSPLAVLSSIEAATDSILPRLLEKGVIDSTGYLNQGWQDALAIMAAPSHRVHITAGDADEVQTVSYYFGTAGAVAHITTDEHHEIAFPVIIDESVEEAGKWMGWRLFPLAEPFSVDLSCDELSIIAAVTDALREDQMRAALERRRPDPSHRFTMPRLAAAIETGSRQEDGRWMTAMLNAHAPELFAATIDRVSPGIAALSRRRWLSVEDEEVTLRSPLPEICLELGGSTPYLVVGIGSGSEPGSYVLAIRGLTGFWTFRFGVPASDQIRFSRLGGKALEGLVYSNLASVLAHHRQDAQASVEHGPTLCLSCRNPLRVSAKFCTRCGAPAA